MKCPSCGDDVIEGKRFCSSCGTDMRSVSPTISRARDETHAGAAAPAPARISGSSIERPARFLPGTVVAERYRIVAQVGRGGMGEVYRADDLKLGQTVALKFLPESLTKNTAAVERMQREVRLARQVSHPNVCRVFDLGEADGVPFISMEFVDGEDLGSLLHRIGRLPQDKALQVAHQLCAGLAEAHAFGVLHRDLKPANVMLDGRGNVRITDFGLAATAEELTGEDARAGTPAYMAPEQLAGQRPTTPSDLYALGLVLYELFSGKEAYPAASITEMLAQRQKGAPAKLSSVVKGIDPAIERVIFQCLERDPQNRPRSALVVAAALPGGDPLSAALAAGETPSPEMVVAAADEPLMSVRRLWLLIATAVVGFAALAWLAPATILALAPLERTPDAMAEHARQLLSRLGYVDPPADTAYWYEADSNYITYRVNHGQTAEVARQWRTAVPAPLRFIYRQGPRRLWAYRSGGFLRVTLTEPANDRPGMITMVLDGTGRLLALSAVPPEAKSATTPPSAPDWAGLLAASGLDTSTLKTAEPKWLPPLGFDSRAAWDGVLGGEPIQVQAAAYRGLPVYFRVATPWAPADAAQVPSSAGSEVLLIQALIVLTMLATSLLARRNVRLGRGDRKGAVRLALAMLVVILSDWFLQTRHVPEAEFFSFFAGAGIALFAAAWTYLAYLAVEPSIRRRWPKMLVSWSRVLAGRFADARVGRDLLVGCAASLGANLVLVFPFALATWVNLPRQIQPLLPPTACLTGISGVLASLLDAAQMVFIPVLIWVVLLLVTHLVVRRRWLAIVLSMLIATPFWMMGGLPFLIAIPIALVLNGLVLFLLFRYGMLAVAAMFFTMGLIGCLLTFDTSRWYFWPTVPVLVILAAMVIHGFRAALAGRPAFGKPVLEE